MQILYQLGAYVDVYPRKAEQAFLHHFQEYDVIINCIYGMLNEVITFCISVI